MAVLIGSNLAAQRALRELGQTDGKLSGVFERLSSGSRITHASDDAAGLSIASTLSAKSRILGRSRLNLSDAQSLLSIADSALGQISTVVSRITELAEQSANGTLSSSQRNSLNTEYQALVSEIQRLSASTAFNRLSLVQGGMNTKAPTTVSGVVTDAAPWISTDGRFQMTQNSATPDVYLIHDSLTGTIKQVSDPSFGQGFNAVQVLANGDVVASYNDTLNQHLAKYSYATGTWQDLAVTSTASDFTSLAVSADGSTVAFSAFTNFTDGSAMTQAGSYGIAHLYALNLNSGIVRASSTGSGPVQDLKISSDGRYVAMGSSAGAGGYIVDFQRSGTLTATNFGAGDVSIFGVSDSGKAFYASTTSTSTISSYDYNSAVTSVVYSGSTSATMSSRTMSLDGANLYFSSTSNLVGQNSQTAVQFFKFDVATGTLSQLTNYSASWGSGGSYVISNDGTRAFALENATRLSMLEYDLTPADTSYDFEAGFGATGRISTSLQSALSAVRGIGAFNLKSAFLSKAALDRFKDDLSTLAQARGVLGAAQSRVSIGEILAESQQVENVAAENRITNADVAAESAQLARLSILRQAGAAVVAQANLQPSIVLMLLK